MRQGFIAIHPKPVVLVTSGWAVDFVWGTVGFGGSVSLPNAGAKLEAGHDGGTLVLPQSIPRRKFDEVRCGGDSEYSGLSGCPVARRHRSLPSRKTAQLLLENCVSLAGKSIRLWTDCYSGLESGKQFTVFLYQALQVLQQTVFSQAVLVRTV